MAVKASQSITLYKSVDVSSVILYFKTVNAGSSAPAKPTTATPTGWSTSEPALDLSKDLYATLKTTFTDDTFSYSDPQKYASYEAAKEAYNLADNATDAVAVLQQKVSDYIVGTQTAATRFWTGVSTITSLADGQQIQYWLPYATAYTDAGTRVTGVDIRINSSTTKAAGTQISTFESGTSTNVVWLNLTLANNTETGWIPCYYGGTSRLTSHYAAGNSIRLTYKVNAKIAGEATTNQYTGWFADANYNSDTTDRLRYGNVIKAGEMFINSGRLIASDDIGYNIISRNMSFRIDKPILYAGSDIAILGTGSNNYLMFSSVNLTNNLTNANFNPAGLDINTSTKWYRGTGVTGTATTGTVFSGSGVSSAVSNSSGAYGDYYTNSSTGYVYKCTLGGNASTAKWAYVKTTAKAAGKKWYSGTAISGTSTTATVFSSSGISNAGVGDYYLNTSTGNYYECTLGGNASTAKWIYKGLLIKKDETVYLRGTLEENIFTVDDIPFTTVQPVLEDGLYYISLGMAYSAYQCGLFPEHPIFVYRDGKFKSLDQIGYNAQVELDNLEIGGRNLLENSSGNLKTSLGWEDNYFEGDIFDPNNTTQGEYISYRDGDGYMNFPYLHYVRDLTSSTKRSTVSNISIGDKIVGGDHLIISGYYRNNAAAIRNIQIWIKFTANSTDTSISENFEIPVSSDWIPFKIEGEVPSLPEENAPYPIFQILFAKTQSHDIDFCAIKIEKGTTVTAWTPAPEDTDSGISVAQKTADDAASAAAGASSAASNAAKEAKDAHDAADDAAADAEKAAKDAYDKQQLTIAKQYQQYQQIKGDYELHSNPSNTDFFDNNLCYYTKEEGSNNYHLFRPELIKNKIQGAYYLRRANTNLINQLSANLWVNEIRPQWKEGYFIYQRTVTEYWGAKETDLTPTTIYIAPPESTYQKFVEYYSDNTGTTKLILGTDYNIGDPINGTVFMKRTYTTEYGEISLCEDAISAQEKTYIDASSVLNIMRGESYVFYNAGEMLVYDAPQKESATKSIRISSSGIAFGTKDEPSPADFDYNSVWTIQGTFDARYIEVINLSAQSIIDGKLTLGNENDGELILKDDQNQIKMEVNTQRFIIFLNNGGKVIIGKDVGLQVLNSTNGIIFGNELHWESHSNPDLFINNTNYYTAEGDLMSLQTESELEHLSGYPIIPSGNPYWTVSSADNFIIGSSFDFGPIRTLTINTTAHKGIGFIKGGSF